MYENLGKFSFRVGELAVNTWLCLVEWEGESHVSKATATVTMQDEDEAVMPCPHSCKAINEDLLIFLTF